jgi:hypothetical protein
VEYALLLKDGPSNLQDNLIPQFVRWNALGGTDMILNDFKCGWKQYW